jgi:hypothetical protein
MRSTAVPALDRRSGPRRLPVELHRRNGSLPDHGQLLRAVTAARLSSNQWSGKPGIASFASTRRQQNARGGGPAPPSNPYWKVKRLFSGPGYSERVPFRAGEPPRPVQHTLGVSYGSVQVATFNCQTGLSLPRARPSNRETVRAARTPRHRHHLPGITTFPSESYAEIGTDSLCTRLSSVVRGFACAGLPYRPGEPPRLSSIPWGSVVARCSQGLSVRRVTALSSSPSNRETVRAVRTPRHRHHLPGI